MHLANLVMRDWYWKLLWNPSIKINCTGGVMLSLITFVVEGGVRGVRKPQKTKDNVQPHEVFSKANDCWSVQLSRSEFLLPEEISPSFQSLLEVTSSLPDHPHNHLFLLGRHCPTPGHGKYWRKSERKIPSPEGQQVDVSLDIIVKHTNY